MSTAAHVIQDEWLLSYAAGSLTPARSLMVASHMSYHDQAQGKVADAEAIGGALLENANPADLDAGVLERLMARLDAAGEVPAEAPVRARSIFPAALAEHIGDDVDALNWRFMGPGMSYVRLWDGPGDERLWLLRAKGGVTVPEHGHTGDEWTLILKGSYRTEAGRFGVGDLDVSDADIEHQPVIDAGEACICLVMTQGPLRMKGLFARMAQPVIGL